MMHALLGTINVELLVTLLSIQHYDLVCIPRGSPDAEGKVVEISASADIVPEIKAWKKSRGESMKTVGPRPEKGEFETSESHDAKMAAWKLARQRAAAPADRDIRYTTFHVELPAKLSSYDADTGCFPQAMAFLNYSCDTARAIHGTRSCVWRPVRQGDTRTVRTFGSNKEASVWFKSHPICLPVEEARALREKVDSGAITFDLNLSGFPAPYARGLRMAWQGTFLIEGNPIAVESD